MCFSLSVQHAGAYQGKGKQCQDKCWTRPMNMETKGQIIELAEQNTVTGIEDLIYPSSKATTTHTWVHSSICSLALWVTHGLVHTVSKCWVRNIRNQIKSINNETKISLALALLDSLSLRRSTNQSNTNFELDL